VNLQSSLAAVLILQIEGSAPWSASSMFAPEEKRIEELPMAA
jgi:hypothetical protein